MIFSDIDAFTKRFGSVRPHLKESGFAHVSSAMVGLLTVNEASDDGDADSANFEVKGL